MTELNDLRISRIEGTAVPVEGNDIDTDRIIPARYLKEITFTSMGNYPFYDERFDTDGNSKGHPFDDPRYQEACILLVNKNFGCGSSREHAPQALMRWGIKAIIGESFAEIFAGNCTMLGIPVLTTSAEHTQELMDQVKDSPSTPIIIDLERQEIRYGGGPEPTRIGLEMPKSRLNALLHGTWDSTGILLSNAEKTRAVAERLPYISGFEGSTGAD